MASSSPSASRTSLLQNALPQPFIVPTSGSVSSSSQHVCPDPSSPHLPSLPRDHLSSRQPILRRSTTVHPAVQTRSQGHVLASVNSVNSPCISHQTLPRLPPLNSIFHIKLLYVSPNLLSPCDFCLSTFICALIFLSRELLGHSYCFQQRSFPSMIFKFKNHG